MDVENAIDVVRALLRVSDNVKLAFAAKDLNPKAAKALVDQYGPRLTITIHCSRELWIEEQNAFQSGVLWSESLS